MDSVSKELPLRSEVARFGGGPRSKSQAMERSRPVYLTPQERMLE
jgi:hypothetical protein